MVLSPVFRAQLSSLCQLNQKDSREDTHPFLKTLASDFQIIPKKSPLRVLAVKKLVQLIELLEITQFLDFLPHQILSSLADLAHDLQRSLKKLLG